MKKGFSLIEVVICMSIIIILTASGLASFTSYRLLANETELMACEDAVISIINNGKQYCRDKEEPGSVLFDTANGNVSFMSLGKTIDSFTFPKGIDLYFINTSGGRVDIDRFGITGDAGTITIRDRYQEFHDITINVGAGYAEIK
jgi:prepilin-type N-terminal cleavage/methylation domain-containing protein